jgi:hypothetical protein
LLLVPDRHATTLELEAGVQPLRCDDAAQLAAEAVDAALDPLK